MISCNRFMRTRRAMMAAAAGSLLTIATARAQSARKPARVAFLTSASTDDRPAFHAFRKSLRDLGWIEGQTLQLAFHFGSGAGQARLDPLAREIAASGVDAVLADGRVATLAMTAATRTIPIVAIMGFDPTTLGLAHSFARPGGNITGISVLTEPLNPKRLEYLRAMAPGARRIGVVFASAGVAAMQSVIKIGATLGLEMATIAIDSLDDLPRRLSSSSVGGLDAFLVGTDGFLDAVPGQVVAPLGRLGKPAIYPDRPYVELGGLASYGVNYSEMFQRLAGYLDHVLRGESPATIPFQQPERFDLTLNLGTAQHLGISFPPMLLAQANEMID